ncbi:uncharacterized protein SCDLUD_001326 [Saccharomycodes ludwigii]|uniref:uncharacterized protein n=1 Tax=Saccharomycodes ludwigii TaxID=36035 RepID=UPI001E849470|nr:hypothetical protein SCDLUD_001326 [Saccharomycodes ludwigii]KAH3901564.1 hypothetical protein SCDLUD_001326 [Saccharomycodes ludwigii]
MDACSPISDPTEGFKVRWFNYTLDDTKSFSSLEYMAYGYYQKSAPYHISDGITTVSFQSGFPCKYSQTDPSVYFLCYSERSGAANNNWYCPSAEAPYNSYTCYNQGVNAYSLPVTSVYTTSGSTITSVIESTIVPNNNNENGSGSPGNASEYVETISSGSVHTTVTKSANGNSGNSNNVVTKTTSGGKVITTTVQSETVSSTAAIEVQSIQSQPASSGLISIYQAGAVSNRISTFKMFFTLFVLFFNLF